MAAVTNFNQVIGVLAKVQSAHGTAETLADASDGCVPFIGDGDPPPPSAVDYVFDGSLGRAPGTLAPQLRTTPNGRFRVGEFSCMPKGAGEAYATSAVKPPGEVHTFLQAAGYTATFVTDHWEYTPTTHGNGYKLITLRQYMHGLQWVQHDVLCDFGYDSTGLGVPIWKFDWRGIGTIIPTTQALPAITYSATDVIPPVASAVIANIGDFDFDTGGLRKVTFARNRKIDSPRINQTLAGGHAGFVPGGAAPTFEIEIERTALVGGAFHSASGIDAEAIREAATSVPVSINYGGATAGNYWTHEFPQAQCINVQPGNDGPIATVTLTMAAHASTPALNDYEIITFG
jgi:hypothetical protein